MVLYSSSYYFHSVWFNLKFCPWFCVNISLLILTAVGYFNLRAFIQFCSSTPVTGIRLLPHPHHHGVGCMSLGTCLIFLWELCLEL